MALALMLTALVMKPQAVAVYQNAIEPFAAGRLGAMEAWNAGSRPIKVFMVKQIDRTHHIDYLYQLYDYAEPDHQGRPAPEFAVDFPLSIVAPAFLLSELTTALMIGFAIFLPFLVIDLVVSSVLAAMGLVMLPPSLVALPLKLIVFVLADGWLLVAGMLLRSFS
jgi:flagellar biosynthetic protein FliP